MLKKSIANALNQQIELESYASYLYLSMASWCEQHALDGCASFFYRQSAEEHDHMMRIFRYLLEMNCKAIVPSVSKPPESFKSVKELFEKVYEHEQKVTNSISRIVELTIKENDHSSHNFLQWFVEEQREEEALVRSILGKIELIGNGPQSLYFIDNEVNKINESSGGET